MIFGTTLMHSQSFPKGNIKISSHNFENYINEAYAFNSRGVNKSRSNQYQAIKSLLKERLFFFESKEEITKALQIQDIPLFNKYNSTLSRDIYYNINTFNPLKYNLPFFSNQSSLYRLGSTNYYLLIKGQNINPN